MEQLSTRKGVQPSNNSSKKSKVRDKSEPLKRRIRNLQLLYAACEANLEEVRRVINHGVDVNFKDSDGYTALHLAAEIDNADIFKLLLKNGAIYVKNKTGETPIDLLNRLDRQYILKSLEDLSLEQRLSSGPTSGHITKRRKADNAKARAQKDRVQTTSSTSNSLHGIMYQIKLLMLFLHRGVTHKYCFRLGTEIEEAKKFDDVVFAYANMGFIEYRFLQVKHKQDQSKKITKQHLLQESDGDFNLVKYFFSYQDSKKEKLFEDGKIRDVTVYTNIDFDPQLSIGIEQQVDKDDILDTESDEKQPMRYKFKEDVIPLLKKYLLSFNITRLARKLAECLLQNTSITNHEETSIFKFYHTVLAEEVINVEAKKFHDKFIEGRDMSESGIKFREAFITAVSNKSRKELTLENINQAIDEEQEVNGKKVGLNLSEDFGEGEDGSWPDNAISDEEIKEFLDHLVFAVNQPNQDELGQIIKNEIGSEIDMNVFTTEDLYNKFLMEMMEWLQGNVRGRFLTHEEGIEFFEEFRRGIPLWFGISNPVKSFTGRVEQLAHIHKALQSGGRTTISQTASISGLGGVGKSETARKYSFDHSTDYNNKIVWINAETYQTLTASFSRLAQDKLRISLLTDEGKQKKIESIVEDVYMVFSKQKCLFIFDNADPGIDTFLPPLTSKANGIYILITSRNQRWGDIEVVLLDKFTEEEARAFIRKALKIEDTSSSHESDIEELISTLQYLPLSLQQAAAYIKAVRTEAKPFRIGDYLKMFKEEARTLLDFEFPDDSCDLYTKTTFTTWKITIDTIRNDPKYGKRASEILDIIAFLASDNISPKIFSRSVSDDEEELVESAFQLLKHYSMINSEEKDGTFSIHRLVQQVIRINLRDQNKEQQTIEEASNLLTEYFPLGSDTAEDISRKRELLPHLEALKSHMDDWVRRNPEDKQRTEENYFEDLLLCMSNGYASFGHSQREKELLEQVLAIQAKHYGPDHFRVAATLGNLGSAYGSLGRYQEQKELFERALLIVEKHFGPDHFHVAASLGNLGNAYGDLGNPHKRKELQERALEIQKNHYGPDHIKVAVTLVNLSNAYGQLGDSQTQKELLEEALPIIAKQYGTDDFRVAAALENLSITYRNLVRPMEQRELLEKALDIKKNFYGPDHFEVARTLVNLGKTYGQLGDLPTKKELLERALPIIEKHYGSDHFQVALTLVNLSDTYGQLGDFETQKELLERALPIIEKHYGTGYFQVAETLEKLGSAYGSLGRYHEQIDLLEKALPVIEKHYGPDHIRVAASLGNLGNAYGSLSRRQQQKEVLERALEIKKDHYGPDHFEVALMLVNLSNAYHQLSDFQTQKVLLEQALPIIEEHFGPDHFQVAVSLVNLGSAYGELGRPQEQKQLQERALEIQKNHYGPDHFEVALTLVNLSNAYYRLGDFQTQKVLLEQALPIIEEHFGPDHFQVAVSLVNLGSAYGELGRPQEQKQLQERALEIQKNHYGPDHILVAATLIKLSNAYGQLGNFPAQTELLEQALNIIEKHYGPNNFQLAVTRVSLCQAFENLGNPQKQEEKLERD